MAMTEIVDYLKAHPGESFNAMQLCAVLNMNWGTFKNQMTRIRTHDEYQDCVKSHLIERSRNGFVRDVAYFYYEEAQTSDSPCAPAIIYKPTPI